MSRSNVGQRPSHLPMPKRRSTKRTRRSARRIVRWRADGVRMAGLGGLWHRGSPSVERQAKCASLSHPEKAGFLEQGHRQNLNARGGGRTHMSAFSLRVTTGSYFSELESRKDRFLRSCGGCMSQCIDTLRPTAMKASLPPAPFPLPGSGRAFNRRRSRSRGGATTAPVHVTVPILADRRKRAPVGRRPYLDG